MKNKFLKLIGCVSAFFLSVFGLTGCRGEMQALYGVPPGMQQDLYGVPAPTQKYDRDEIDDTSEERPDMPVSETLEISDEL